MPERKSRGRSKKKKEEEVVAEGVVEDAEEKLPQSIRSYATVERPKREWEVWDEPHMAERVDTYWKSSANEIAHRRKLAMLTRDAARGGTVLEIGCGTGLVYEALTVVVGPKLEYVGIDNSPAMLKIARKRYPSADFREEDAFKLPFKDGEFDVAVAFEVFGHMPDCAQPLGELLRVAKKTALFSFWPREGRGVSPMGDGRYEYGMEEIYLRIAWAFKDKKDRRMIVSTTPVPPVVVFSVQFE